MVTKERRSYVRGALSFNVKYKLVTSEEYEDLKKFDRAIFSPLNKTQAFDVADTDIRTDSVTDASLINFLVQMDEKLDQILELLSQDRAVAVPFRQGVGDNISGSGMQLVIDEPVDCGQIVHSKFFLSKSPLVFMDVFGEVIRVTQVNKDDRTLYQAGVKFIDLNLADREKIITSVFQRQREAIRKRKDEEQS